MGWFDCVASRYGVRMQGATEVALTVLDVLGYLDEIPVCVGYEIDGEVVKDFPVTAKLKKQNQYTKYFQDGKKKYVESKNTTNYQKTVVNTSNSSKRTWRTSKNGK